MYNKLLLYCILDTLANGGWQATRTIRQNIQEEYGVNTDGLESRLQALSSPDLIEFINGLEWLDMRYLECAKERDYFIYRVTPAGLEALNRLNRFDVFIVGE